MIASSGSTVLPCSFKEKGLEVQTCLLSNHVLVIGFKTNIYRIDMETQQVEKIEDHKKVGAGIRKYWGGILYQKENDLIYWHDGDKAQLSTLPDGYMFTGMFSEHAVLAEYERNTYVYTIKQNKITPFIPFPVYGYGINDGKVLLVLNPKAGGGATPTDVLWNWDFLVGGDLFQAWIPSIYDIKTGIFINMDPNMHSPQEWLDIPYDKKI